MPLLLVLLVAAGCGGGEREPAAGTAPTLAPALASELARLSDAVAAALDANDPCAARPRAEELQARTIAAVNARRVPPAFQEELTAAVTALAASIECPE